MKVLILTHYFPPEGNAPASRTHEHAKRWVARGIDVTVITGNPNVPHGHLYPGYRNWPRKVDYIDGIRVVRMWTYLAANAGSIRRTLNYLSFMLAAVLGGLNLPRPDVIVATSPQFFCGWAGVILSRLRQVRFVLEIRDIWPDSIAAVGAIRQSLVLQFLSLLEQRMYQAADQIVTVGEGYRATLLERGVTDKKMTVIPNGADLDRFKIPDTVTTEPLPPRRRSVFHCLYVGTIGMASRLDLVIEAAKRCQEGTDSRFHFMVVGDGADRSRLEALARKWDLGNVTFTGLIPKREIPHYLQLADVCLVHLREDPLFATVLPSKMFEAMAMAKPIILGLRGSASKILQEAKAGIPISPESTDELLKALNRLERSPALREKCGLSGRAFVQSFYNRKRLADLYLTDVLKS